MGHANDLPQDLWELIAAYLEPRELDGLIGINRQLLNMVLDERYRIVSWVDSDKGMARKLKRLEDPAIASHVRRLYIQAWFMKRLFNIPLDRIDGQPNGRTSPKSGMSKSIQKLLCISDSQHVDTDDVSIPFARRIGFVGNTRTILGAMSRAMRLMVNVKEFVVEWRNLPLTTQAKAFLTSANHAFQSNLCKVTLSGHLTRLRSLIPLMGGLRLEELNLHFDWNTREDSISKQNESVMLDVVAPYICSLKATLRVLRITSQASGDHSYLFRSLGSLPQLHKLVLQIPFDKEQMSEPRGLVTLLQTNTFGLHHLELIPTLQYEEERLESTRQNWTSFCNSIASLDPWFPNLKTLHLALPTSQALTHSLLSRIPDTVTDIRLASRYLDLAEITSMATILSDRVCVLTRLSLETVNLTPDVLRVLAAKFPALYSLTFVIEKDDSLLYRFFAPPSISSRSQQTPSKIDWNLVDLSIYIKYHRTERELKSGYSNGIEQTERSMMLDVKELVGSISSFKGTGNTWRC